MPLTEAVLWGLGVPFSLMGACALVPVPCSRVLWGFLPQGLSGFCQVWWRGPLGCVESHPILSLYLRVVPRP